MQVAGLFYSFYRWNHVPRTEEGASWSHNEGCCTPRRLVFDVQRAGTSAEAWRRLRTAPRRRLKDPLALWSPCHGRKISICGAGISSEPRSGSAGIEGIIEFASRIVRVFALGCVSRWPDVTTKAASDSRVASIPAYVFLGIYLPIQKASRMLGSPPGLRCVLSSLVYLV
ncbi:hypothetical protein PMIN01_11494 [Paraphaeosphaeria minitans]|uniref:Uncharacterized protein n=1 Tax=Paraphaeosphaeria minitans TaxID=565426 RepID=A0A9P6GA35_9PLEO|nr:hypothetical protein PMIN01_11494 [Paraphaeosphaeria minitans]